MKPQKDYSFIRGVCHGWYSDDEEQLYRELGYAKRLGINSTRCWMMYQFYWKDPENYIAKMRKYIRVSWEHGISTMPILWNGNMMDPGILEPSFWAEKGDQWVKDIVGALKDEPGIIMWDVMNEPSCNDYLRQAGDERPGRWDKMTAFLHHYCDLVRTLDPENTITIGHTFVEDIEPTADCVDVISFHDYLETRKRIEATYTEAERLSEKYGKPIINSELSCLGRSNPYDLSMQVCQEHKVGFYVFELMIHGYWGDVHGLVYPDGTIRDPAVIAAMFGFFRKTDAETRIKENPNKEGHVKLALQLVEEVLSDDVTLFQNKKTSTEDILEAAEYCANQLESSQMVPMFDPPRVQIETWRKMPEEKRDRDAIRAFTYDLAMQLKKFSQIM